MKSIEFEEEPAVAVYFYDFSHHMESMKLQGEVIKQKSRNESLKERHVTVSHEFRTPLTSSLMLLEGIISKYQHSEGALKILWLVISQINMLLCLVNDSLDIQLIEQGLFVAKVDIFSPEEIFKFILNMFEPSMSLLFKEISLTYQSVGEICGDP